MIFYAQDYERWEDEDDPNFTVDMTPEAEADLTFETQDDFWEWYRPIPFPHFIVVGKRVVPKI